jgi:hypothetical protein
VTKANLTVAEQIACAICWLSKQSGLPDIPVLRSAVSQRHGLSCDWCDYPPDYLLELARVNEDTPAARTFARLSPLAQRQLVDKALHAEGLALV